jgi:hypothetical protein
MLPPLLLSQIWIQGNDSSSKVACLPQEEWFCALGPGGGLLSATTAGALLLGRHRVRVVGKQLALRSCKIYPIARVIRENQSIWDKFGRKITGTLSVVQYFSRTRMAAETNCPHHPPESGERSKARRWNACGSARSRCYLPTAIPALSSASAWIDGRFENLACCFVRGFGDPPPPQNPRSIWRCRLVGNSVGPA